MTRTRPTMASHRLDLPSICDICGKARSTRKHAACSRTRQQLKQDEWADALHDYEELGVAINLNHHRVQGAKVNALIRAVALRGKTENQTDRTLMGHLVARLASDIGLPYQPELVGM